MQRFPWIRFKVNQRSDAGPSIFTQHKADTLQNCHAGIDGQAYSLRIVHEWQSISNAENTRTLKLRIVNASNRGIGIRFGLSVGTIIDTTKEIIKFTDIKNCFIKINQYLMLPFWIMNVPKFQIVSRGNTETKTEKIFCIHRDWDSPITCTSGTDELLQQTHSPFFFICFRPWTLLRCHSKMHCFITFFSMYLSIFYQPPSAPENLRWSGKTRQKEDTLHATNSSHN